MTPAQENKVIAFITKQFHILSSRGGWSQILRLPQAAMYAHATQVNPLSQQNNNMMRDNKMHIL